MANITPLCAELQKIANDELGEVSTRIPEELAALKEWIQQTPHLKARLDDQFLIQFLRGCKYSREKAKEKLDLFYSLKTKYPDMMNVTDVEDARFREIHRMGCFIPLPTPLNGNGPRIVVFRYTFSTSTYNIEDLFGPGVAFHEVMLMQDPFASICGLIYVVDFEKATASHFLQMTPNFCKKLMSFLEKSMPLRIKAVYYINTSAAAQQFFKILFPFFSEKLRQRVHIIGNDLSKLREDIDSPYLPKEYGGQLPSMLDIAADYAKEWDAHRDYFKENAQYGTDESLRPGKPLDLDGLFGVGGTFRKLNVD